jgi:hypothetical protein
MGLDFIRNAAPSFNRVLDRRLVEMNSPKLFTRNVPIVSRSARAELCGETNATLGEKLLLRIADGKVIVQRQGTVIAECPSPPDGWLSHLRASAGICDCEVTSVQPLSQTLEIEICE